MAKIEVLEFELINLCKDVGTEHLWQPEIEKAAHKAVSSEILTFVKDLPDTICTDVIDLMIDFIGFDCLWATERLLALSALSVTSKQTGVQILGTAKGFYKALSKTYPYGSYSESETPLLISSFEEQFSIKDSAKFCENIRTLANITLHALNLK